jgi:hypothetical protein
MGQIAPDKIPHWLRKRWINPREQIDYLIHKKTAILNRIPLAGGLLDMLIWSRNHMAQQAIDIGALQEEIRLTRLDCQRRLDAMQDLLEINHE